MRVVATAGHVDHGKSTLVRALTGMEPDRWAEEQRRGMTIDLGFAWMTLPSGERVAFVDVPGHQRFIANMLAGLGPAPALLFVVAADGGWSAQSAEHLAAARALDVRHAVLAITRCDLADPGAALRDASRHLAAAGLPAAPAVCVSGRTGAGLDGLRTALDAMLTELPAPELDAPVRLWIDRSFTIRGSGTVVTGTLAAGRVAVNDTLQLGARTVTVRAVQSLGAPVRAADAVARVALNLRGVAAAEIARGDVLLTPQRWHLTGELDVFCTSPDEVAGRVTLHVGTTAVGARVRPLGGAVVRLRLDRPLPMRTGDRAVLRDPGRQAVVAGVRVLDADPPALVRRGDAGRRAAALRDGPPTVAAEVARRGSVRLAHLTTLGLTAPVDGAPGRAGDGVRIVGDWAVAPGTWQQWLGAARGILDAWATSHPLEPDMPLPALARALHLPTPALAAPVLGAAGITTAGGYARAAARPAGLGAAEPGIRTLESRLAGAPFAAPESADLAGLLLGRRELAAAVNTGRLLVLDGDVVLLPSAVDAAVAALTAIDAPFTLSEARQALGTTRRVAVPLLEHLDSVGRTARVDGRLRRVVPPPTAG